MEARGLENGALYAVLYYRGEATSWHWSLFLPNPSVNPIGKDGTSFQVSDAPLASASTDASTTTTTTTTDGVTSRWKYGCSAENIVESLHTVLCVKLGEVHLLGSYADAVQWLHDTLSAVPVVPPTRPRLLAPPPCLIIAHTNRDSASTLPTPPNGLANLNPRATNDDSDDADSDLTLDLTADLITLDDRERTHSARSDHTREWTCRAWFLAAVADLHDLGILSCHNVTMLEHEIKNRAVLATMSFVDWGGTTVCTSKHCS